jgi:hypothetical protein
MTNAEIEPKTFIVEDTVTSFEVRCTNYTLYTTASFIVIMNREDGSTYKTDMLNLTPEEFALWGDDDDYIKGLVCSKYGFTLK